MSSKSFRTPCKSVLDSAMRRELRFMRRFAGVLLPDFASAVLSSSFFLADHPEHWSWTPRNGFELDFLESPGALRHGPL